MKERKEGFRSSRHCGNVYNWLSHGIVGNSVCRTWESCPLAFPCAVNRVIHDSIACYAHFHNACLWFLWFGIVWCWRSISCFRLLASLPYMSNLRKVHNLMKSGSPFHKRKLPLNHLFQNLFYIGDCHFKALSKMV